MYKRALVAIDGSPWSDAAVDHALTLARVHQFDLCFLYVEPRHRWFATEAQAQAKGEQILAVAEARAVLAGVSCEAHMARGNIPETIRNIASEKACDVAILGARGMSGLKRLTLGNISHAVSAKATVPVLIVKHFLSLPT